MNTNIQRKFLPGDKWLYFKIYSGPKTSDRILTEIILPETIALLKDKVVDKWFFVRYSDPEYHLRIRFYCNEEASIMIVISKFLPYLKSLTNDNLIWKIQMDTYARELERYGSNTIELCENIFYSDSQMIIEFLDMIEGDEGEELRWLFAIKAIDSFLDSFEYSIPEKHKLLGTLSRSFAKEFKMTKPLKRQLDMKYRKSKSKIENFMSNDGSNVEFQPIFTVLNSKKEEIKYAIAEILRHQRESTLEVPLERLLRSFIHMQLNRIFKSKNRLHELVCYTFLFKYYSSTIARGFVQNRMVS